MLNLASEAGRVVSATARLAPPAAALAVTLMLGGCGGGGGAGRGAVPGNPAQTYFDPTLYSTAPAASLAQANELAAVTHHQIVLNGATLAYSATTGHLTAVSPTNGAPEASFFYVAYTLDGKDPSMR